MTVEQQVSSSSGLCRLRMLLSGLSFEPSTNSDSDTPSTNSPALLCSSSDDDDDESNNNDNSMALAMELKADEIQRCLAGTANGDESLVDLWHLRTLSLSTGGLLNSTLRKRSWPKLLGIDETILLNNSAAPSSSVMANSGNIRSLAASTLAIQSALAKIGKSSSPSGATGGLLWDVEGQIKATRGRACRGIEKSTWWHGGWRRWCHRYGLGCFQCLIDRCLVSTAVVQWKENDQAGDVDSHQYSYCRV